jgi:MoxR-like ATPase
MRHRVGLTYEAEAEEVTADKIITQVVERTPVPSL